MFVVREIIEPDFGCEGVPDGQEPLCEVVLADENGARMSVAVPDAELYKKKITEGAFVEFTNGILSKIE